jgi:hypothetical protein
MFGLLDVAAGSILLAFNVDADLYSTRATLLLLVFNSSAQDQLMWTKFVLCYE